MRENPIKMDDLGVPLFLETPIYTKHDAHISLLPRGSMNGIYLHLP